MERCYFAKAPPDIEVRGGLVFIKVHGGCEVAVTPHILAKFVACANRALEEWRVEQSGKVERLESWRAVG